MPAQPIDTAAVLATALRLADAGIAVFPCVPGAKRPLTAHGMLDASTDPDQIRRWWRRTPTANLAIPTGPGSVDVLDVDRRPTGSGYPAFRTLAQAGLLDGYTRVVATPSGGMHVYFPGSTQPSARLPEQFIDFKAAGGYVLIPPSVITAPDGAGAGYAELRHRPGPGHPIDWARARDLLAPPAEARRALRPLMPRGSGGPGGHGVGPLAAWVATLPEGRRNNGTFWAACRATEEGHTNLRPIIHAAVRAGLSEIEAHRTVTSAQRLIGRHHPPPAPTAVVRGRR